MILNMNEILSKIDLLRRQSPYIPKALALIWQAAGIMYDLRTGTLADAWSSFVPRVLNLRSQRYEFLESCRKCALVNLCLWCPAHAHLETGEMDKPVDYFCAVAHARAALLQGEEAGLEF